jgi:hypothetical protein
VDGDAATPRTKTTRLLPIPLSPRITATAPNDAAPVRPNAEKCRGLTRKDPKQRRNPGQSGLRELPYDGMRELPDILYSRVLLRGKCGSVQRQPSVQKSTEQYEGPSPLPQSRPSVSRSFQSSGNETHRLTQALKRLRCDHTVFNFAFANYIDISVASDLS